MIVYTYAEIGQDSDRLSRILPCVAWPFAEDARAAAEAAHAIDSLEPLQWEEFNDRRDGKYPSWVAKGQSVEYRVYPIEILPTAGKDE